MRPPAPDPAGPDEESVWNYPRPPRLEPVAGELRVEFGGEVVARTLAGHRVLETSHPPVYYIPPGDVAPGALRRAAGSSGCEWKGEAIYFDVLGGGRVAGRAAWAYPRPVPAFAAIAGHVAFYAGAMDGCFVAGERVRPQPGGFYGGWVTARIKGPFKGVPGSGGW